MGRRDIRRLPIVGAVAVVRWAARKGAPRGLVAGEDAGAQAEDAGCVAKRARTDGAFAWQPLANRMARTAWAFAIRLGPVATDGSLRKGEDCRDPAMATAWVNIAGVSPRM